jgi:cytochrome c biogenesis protein CcdA
VAVAGLVDSINPCAFATLVFFMSLLSLSRVGRRGMLLAGGAFVAACFVTYLLLGFGALRVLHLFVGFRLLRQTLDAAMVGALAVLAWLSFQDAVRFRRTGNPHDVALRLPEGINRRIHDVMRRGLRRRNLLAGGFGVGVVVTALESVCTGQVYVPTLVLVVRTGQSVTRGLLYLVVYNLMFILPLAIILVLTYRGLGTPALMAWSRRNVVVSKILLGVFFVGMAALIVAL